MKRTEILKKLINETGLSMRAFSEKTNIPNTTLHSMLNRGIGNASVDNVIKVCKSLEITVEQLEEMAENNRQVPSYLMGWENNGRIFGLNRDSEDMLNIYGGLNAEEKEKAKTFLKFLHSQNKK